MSSSPVPRAFVSWAHSDDEWTRTVAEFVTRLRGVGGVDADVDLFHAHEPGIDWSTYGPDAIRQSDFVLVAVSPTYARYWRATGLDRASGGMLEAYSLKQSLREERQRWVRRVMIVVLPGATTDDVPAELRAARRFEISSFDRDGLDELLRAIHDKPKFEQPELAPLPTLPPPEVVGTRRGSEERPFRVRAEADACSGAGENLAEHVGETIEPDVVDRFIRELKRFMGSQRIDSEAIERGARIVAAEQSWRAGLGVLLDEADVARLLDVDRHRVADLAADDELIALASRDGGTRYPAFQFQDGMPTPTLARAHRVLVEVGHVSPWSAASWARTAHPELDSRSPAQWAGEHRDDARLLTVAKRDAARAAQ